MTHSVVLIHGLSLDDFCSEVEPRDAGDDLVVTLGEVLVVQRMEDFGSICRLRLSTVQRGSAVAVYNKSKLCFARVLWESSSCLCVLCYLL